MLRKVFTSIFGSRNDRVVKRLGKVVTQINALEPEMEKMRDAEFPHQTQKLKERIEAGESLEKVLPEAFAMVREAARRCLSMRHFDVQLIGGMVLNNGNIAEMRTGEGKTLVATLPAYLNALTGNGVHIITVNDYLAQRDAEWMGQRTIGPLTGSSGGAKTDARRHATAGSSGPGFRIGFANPIRRRGAAPTDLPGVFSPR